MKTAVSLKGESPCTRKEERKIEEDVVRKVELKEGGNVGCAC